MYKAARKRGQNAKQTGRPTKPHPIFGTPRAFLLASSKHPLPDEIAEALNVQSRTEEAAPDQREG